MDATLFSINPTNSLGGQGVFLAGVTQNGTYNRGLLRFAVASAVPHGSKVINANVSVVVVKQSGEHPVEGIYGLHRLLTSWGEGTNATNQSFGLGIPAQPGDATWAYRFFPANAWAAPGGQADMDYVDASSSSCSIGDVGVFTFDVSGDLLADVQLWLDQPELNFGWMLRDDIEDFSPAGWTARRFLSRENGDPNFAPRLFLAYLPPPIISTSRLTNDVVQLSFDADPGGIYTLEMCSELAATNTWSTLTNFGYITQPTTLTWSGTATNVTSFFRVRAQ